MAYERYFPGKTRFIYTVGGVINPDPSSQEAVFPNLMKDSQPFGEMARELFRLNQEGVPDRIVKKMVAFVAEGTDGIVPKPALEPDWADLKMVKVADGGVVQKIMGGHVSSIAKALRGDLKRRSEEWRKADLS